MTETQTTPEPGTPEYEEFREALGAGQEFDELTEESIQVESVALTFTIRVTGVETLGEAIDVAALSVARNGLNSFHILAEDADSDRSWLAYGGQVADTRVSAAEALAAALDKEEAEDEEEAENEAKGQDE